MKNDIEKIHAMATTAIEALKLAFQENPDKRTSGLILAALAMVTQMREEVSQLKEECSPSEDYCFPV